MPHRPDSAPPPTPARHSARSRRVVLGGLFLIGGVAAFVLGPSSPAHAAEPPFFTATVTFGDLFGCGWLADDVVTVTIKDAPAGTTQFSGPSPTDGEGCFFLQGDETGVSSFPAPVGSSPSTTAPPRRTSRSSRRHHAGQHRDRRRGGTAAPGRARPVWPWRRVRRGVPRTDADGSGGVERRLHRAFELTGFSRINATVFDPDGDDTSVFREGPHLLVNLDFDCVCGCGLQNGT